MSGFLLVAVMLTSPLPSPTPPPESTPTPSPSAENVEVTVLRPQAERLRRGFAKSPACVAVPRELLRRPPDVVTGTLAAGAKLAGSGKTLGILIPQPDGSFKLVLLQRQRVAAEYFLRLPGDERPRVSRFAVSADGSYAILFIPSDRFAVFAQGNYVATIPARNASAAVVRGELHFCPTPPGFESHDELRRALEKGKDLPPLWVRSEINGSREEVLLRVESRRLDPKYPSGDEWALKIAARADGKLWLVGPFSAEVLLATPGGRILRSEVIPFRFPTEAEDTQAVERQAQELLKDPSFSEKMPPPFYDATKPKPRIQLLYRGASRIFWDAWAKGNDLVLLTTAFTKPASAVLVYSGNDREIPCFTFGDVVKGEPKIAVTDEELWLAEPFGYFRWDELEELLESSADDARAKGKSPPERNP